MTKTLKLRPAQVKAYHWLKERKEAALFMGCGLGKTATCLSLIAEMLLNGETKGVLVVAPKRVCNLVWPFEPAKWEQLTWLRVANLRTKDGWALLEKRQAHVYIINYEQLPKLAEKYFHNRRQAKWAFDTVIYDELTKAKNPKSIRIKSVRRYMEKLERRWGLTGTPTPNGLLNLFGQIRVLDKGARFGVSHAAFRARYFKPVDYHERVWRLRNKSAGDAITKKISDLAITLKSSDFLEIPDTTKYDLEIALPQRAKKAYVELAKELYLLLKGKEVTAVNSAVLVNKLLQITSGAIYGDVEDPKAKKPVIEIHDAKINVIKKFVKQLDEPVLIACVFRHEQERILKAIEGCVRFDSAKTERAQIQLQDQWNAKKIPAIVAHPASIGHGLNLQGGGRTIIWMTPTWDRELYDQMNARVARTGQNQQTQIYHVLVSETMDDAVMSALEQKDDEQNALLDVLKKFQTLYENR